MMNKSNGDISAPLDRLVRRVFISFSDICESSLPPNFYIITRLIQEGAPIEIMRQNKFDVSEFREGDYKITGQITKWEDWEWNGLIYSI